MAVIKKTKTISKSKTIKGSISRKQFNKFRKSGSTTRKMRGGAKFIIKPSNSGPGKMKSKKKLWERTKSWAQLHAPGGKAIQSNRNEKAKLTQIANMAKQREEYYSQNPKKTNILPVDPNLKANYLSTPEKPVLNLEPIYIDPASLEKQKQQKKLQSNINMSKLMSKLQSTV